MIEKILASAAILFIEKGFEGTKTQDICNKAGVSKGALYHHFPSKESLLNGVIERQAQENKKIVDSWLEEGRSLCGRDALIALLEKTFSLPDTHVLDSVLSNQVKSADFVVSYMKNTVESDATMVTKLIERGRSDGSCTTEFPEELAEVFMLLLNIWCDPVVFHCDGEKLKKRLHFLGTMMESMGVPILFPALQEKIHSFLLTLYPYVTTVTK